MAQPALDAGFDASYQGQTKAKTDTGSKKGTEMSDTALETSEPSALTPEDVDPVHQLNNVLGRLESIYDEVVLHPTLAHAYPALFALVCSNEAQHMIRLARRCTDIFMR